MKGGVDNAAHVGGLLSGVLIGYCFYPSLKKPGSSTLEYATIALLSLFAIVTSFTVYHKIPNDIGKYDEQMKSFASMENTALAVYRLPKGAPKEKLLSAITDSGLVYWNKNIELLNGMEKLKVPPSVKDRTDILINYCNLRIKAFHLIYKAINEDTDIYQDSITSYNTQIEAAINSLKGK
jgi:rhomboid protease GluP